jgi:hypothetical protein
VSFTITLEDFVRISFFTSDLFRFGSTLRGIIISSWVIISLLKERMREKVYVSSIVHNSQDSINANNQTAK